MNRDPSGYYGCLGIGTDASHSEIKSAYRALAKKYHPDVNPDPIYKHRFADLSEAYSVLGDVDKRAVYDASAYESSAVNADDNELLEPIKCSVCHRATASPRIIVFRSVCSLVFTTITTPRHGIFCSSCARKAAFRASLVSGLFGWWGVPWGPLLTIKEIIKNAAGGERHPELDDKLSYYNAIAFASRGQMVLAHAIARQLRGARDEMLARDAMRLAVSLEELGVPANSPALKSAWRRSGKDGLMQIAALAGVPLIVFILISSSIESDGVATNPRQDLLSSETTASPHDSSQLADPAVSVDVKSCENLPRNGEEFGRAAARGDGHRITVKNGGVGDALVKIREINTNKTISTMYVERGNQASFVNVPDGSYSIFYATGDKLDESCKKFLGNFQAKQFPGFESFKKTIEGDYIVYSDLTLTLFNVTDGNVRPKGVSDETFDSL